MSSVNDNFRNIEYQALKAEILERMKLVRQSETFCVTATGSIWAFVFNSHHQVANLTIPWIASGIALIILGTATITSFDRVGIVELGKFIKDEIESKLTRDTHWETSRQKPGPLKSQVFFWSRHSLFFGIVTITNIFFALSYYLTFNNHPHNDELSELIGFISLFLISIAVLKPICRIEKVEGKDAQ